MAQLARQVVGQTGLPAGVAVLQAVVHWEGETEPLLNSQDSGVVRCVGITRYSSM